MGRNEFFDDQSFVPTGAFDANCGPTQAADSSMRYSVTEPVQQQKAGGTTVPLDEPMDRSATEIADAIMVDGKRVAQTVGWMVCIKGMGRGIDYHLHSGYNSIGNSDELDICVRDRKVSHRPVVKVAYDPKSRAYTLLPCGDGVNIVYCNDEALYVPQKLNIYDVITLGDTQLMFVPLCGEKFAWENEE